VQLGPGGDAELRVQAVQVSADGAVGNEQPLADLLVGEPCRRQLGDLKLLRRQLVACFWCTAATRLARGSQFLPGSLAPGNGAEGIERVAP